MKIGLDTNILSCLINAGEEDFKAKVLKFLTTSTDVEIVVSSIVMAELYSWLEPGEISQIKERLENMIGNITIIKFDEKSSIENGLLVNSIGLQGNESRQKIKADFLIMSNCLAYGCTHFLTADDSLINKFKYNNQHIEMVDTKTLPEPEKDLLGSII